MTPTAEELAQGWYEAERHPTNDPPWREADPSERDILTRKASAALAFAADHFDEPDGMYHYELRLDVKRIDALGRLEEGTLLRDLPWPIRSITVEGVTPAANTGVAMMEAALQKAGVDVQTQFRKAAPTNA
jgi:hypothetical protein